MYACLSVYSYNVHTTTHSKEIKDNPKLVKRNEDCRKEAIYPKPSYTIHTNLSKWASLSQESWTSRRKISPGLPWWLSGKESTWQCRYHRSDAQGSRIAQVTQQLSPMLHLLSLSSSSWGPPRLKPTAQSLYSTTREQPLLTAAR